MSTEGDVASYTGEAIGKIDSSGTVSWRGSLFYNHHQMVNSISQ